MGKREEFRVIIAGGGVAALALANALERGGIDYVLLERRGEIAPQVGASIGLMPNGCRILDQLGVLDSLYEQTAPIERSSDRGEHGQLLAPVNDMSQLTGARSGYDIAFGDRQLLLEVLAKRVQDKSKIKLNKTVTDIRHFEDRVEVHCEDGTSYSGDVLAGCDGVASKTREAMWRLAESEHPEQVKRDRKCMTAGYQCLFGIANATRGFDAGEVDYLYSSDGGAITICSKAGRMYYFIFGKLDRTYGADEIPRYSGADASRFAASRASMPLRPGVTFGDVFGNTVSYRLTALEEATFGLWSWGRIACLGDSIHKMTPNVGAGGNAAVESAAQLANQLHALLSECDAGRGRADELGDPANNAHSARRPTLDQVKRTLAAFQKSREVRTGAITATSHFVSRLQAQETLFHRFFAGYLIAPLGDFLADMQADNVVGAAKIDYLPVPEASTKGTMPFNPSQGVGQSESKLLRALIALPLLVVAYAGRQILDPAAGLSMLREVLTTGIFNINGHAEPIVRNFYNVERLDKLWGPINLFFMPQYTGYDAVSRAQTTTFLFDYGVILAIWSIESSRRGNALTLAQLPVLFTMAAQLFAGGVLSPVYYFLHYVFSPIEVFKATDMRLTKLNFTMAVLPALALGYYLPTVGMFYWPDMAGRAAWLFVWQMFPVWLQLAHSVLGRVLFPATEATDRLRAPNRDLPAIRLAVGATVAISAAVWLKTFALTADFSPLAMAQTLLPNALLTHPADLTELVRLFLQWDEVLMFSATALWLALLFWDLKAAGMTDVAWARYVGLGVAATLALGPGAATGLTWLWREEILATRRHKDAVTKEKAEVVNTGIRETGARKAKNGATKK